jgi:hypothetical protein
MLVWLQEKLGLCLWYIGLLRRRTPSASEPNIEPVELLLGIYLLAARGLPEAADAVRRRP